MRSALFIYPTGGHVNVQSTSDTAAPDQPEAGSAGTGPGGGDHQGLRLLAGEQGSSGDRRGGRFALAFRDESRTCVIVGGGPSASHFRTEDFGGHAILVVNDAYRLHPSAQALYAADSAWWRIHRQDVLAAGFKGRCFCSDEQAASSYGIEARRVVLTGGLSRDPAVLNAGGRNGNSGAQAMNLAYHGGARRLILIGFDMGGQGPREHWFGAHPRGLRNDSPYQLFVEGMMKLAMDLAAHRIEVLNGSQHSKLGYWPRLSPDEVRQACAPTA